MLFSVPKEKVHIFRYLTLVLLFVLLIVFILFSNQMKTANDSRGKELLDRALTRSITQCYALEGAYPPSIEYLSDNYGLTYDHDSYFVDYTYIGSNLRPDYTIIERNTKR